MASKSSLSQRKEVDTKELVKRTERRARKLLRRLATCSEADLKKVAHILEPYEIGNPPVKIWAIIEPGNLEGVTCFADEGLYFRTTASFATFEAESEDAVDPNYPDVQIPHFVLWRDCRFETEAWVGMLERTYIRMKEALDLLKM